MNFHKSILFVLLTALLCQQGSGSSFHRIYLKNDLDVTSYPSVGNKFQRPVIDGLPLRNLENAIFKSRANNLKDIFRHSVDTIKMKSKKVDIIFLIDSSSSIGKVNFHSEINFVKKLLVHFDLSFNYTRIALITFSSNTKVVRHIDQISKPNEDHDQCSAVTNDIPQIEFIGGGTYTYGALKEAQTIFKTARPKSRKYVFLVTDGFSNGRDPIPVAEDLKANNVTIFTIGIQSGNYGELYNISSYPKETHNFLLDSFKEFEKLARSALRQDHKLGYSIKLSKSDRCNVLCKDDFGFNPNATCCNALASCECRIPSGHYSCACPDGYVGEGLGEDCLPCMRNTYWFNSAKCLPCPDINHVTLVSPALSLKDCICKPGFKRTADDRCEGITCSKLNPPENGYFVTQPATCANVLNAACGARCKSGYQLTGSSLRLCQENGTWSGTEAQCLLKTCPSLPVPLNGMITCQNHDLELSSYDYTPHNDTFMTTYKDETKRRTEPMPIDTECSYRCGPGNYLVGSRNRNCLPLSKWDGRQTTCKTVLCAPLPKPKFGSYKLPECTKTKQPYGTNCTLLCPEGFTLKGPETRTCFGKKNGLWTPKNKNSKCVDITPPKLVCPLNYTLELPADSDSIVLHSLPLPLEAQDSSTSTVTIWTKPSVDDTAGVRLKMGHHTFTYFASDEFSNKAECNFRVTVLDRTPPSVENCVDPEEFWISKDVIMPPIEWEEPIFVDNSNEAVSVKILTALDPRKAVSLVAGEYPVLYTAKDRSRNYNECLLNITVKELSCEPLEAPQHGLSYCARNATHTWCEVTCDDGYAIFDEDTAEYLDNFRISCNHKHPGWKYKTIPDCTKLDLPESIGQTFTITLDSENPLCSSQDTQNTFGSSLSDQMKAYLCSDLTDCDIISEIPECLQENDEKDDPPLGDREKYHISKREAPSDQSSPKKNRKRVRSIVKIRLYTKISKRLGLWQKNATLSENIRQMKYQVQRLDTNEPLKRVLQDMQIDVKRLKIEDFIRCPDGSVSKKNVCFQCARGTYQDAAFNRCKLCPLGTFNPDYGQLVCFACPQHHSTRREGRLYETDCKAQCPPGTWAKTRPGQRRARPGLTTPHSLMPFCRKCLAGEYQPTYDQTSCLQCPTGLVSPRGSTSLYDCQGERPHICELQPRICGPFGQCVPETGGDDLYSCICPEGYLGPQCEQRVDPCHSAPCYNNGMCSHINETMVACHCPPEFTGDYCEDLRNSCNVTVCKNGGTCMDLDDAGPVCECPAGFEGKYCEEAVNYCDSMPCESGICHNQSNGYSCQCPPGVIGRRCHLRPCDNLPCHRNAICVDLMDFPATRGSYECKCPTGLRGPDCTQIVDPCEEYPCKNNGICKPVALRQVGIPTSDGVHSDLLDDEEYLKFTCTCPPYFYGERCEVFTKPDFVMKFLKASTLNYVEMKGPDHDMSELSFCTWLRTSDTFTYGSVLSYATKEHDNAFTLTDYSGFVLYVNGNSSDSDIVANDGEWHFICVSWTSENGYYEMYFDGRLEHAGMNLSAGEHIPGKGIFIIGQEQDKLGGGFSETESFIGQIAYLDVWDSFLSGEQIHNFYTSCDPYRGALYSWTDFKANIRGDIDIIPSAFCQACPRDLHMTNGIVRYMANRAFYQCNPGYNLRGFAPVRHCLRTSRWSAGVPYCEVVNCEALPPVENGQIEYSSGTTLHSVAEYVCNNGYAVDGNDKRICLTMGEWSGVEPVCRSSVQCEQLVLPPNMTVSYANDKGLIPDDQEFYPVGVYAEITCRLTMNYYFVTCMDDGRWDGSVPDCVSLEQPVTTSTTQQPTTTTITSTTETLTSTTETTKRLTFEWSIPDTWPTDQFDLRSTTLAKPTTLVPPEESGSSTEFQTTAPSEESSESLTTKSSTSVNPESSTTPTQQIYSFPHPDKDFWSLLYEFLYKGCLDESAAEITLCSLKVKPVPYINLYTSGQSSFERFPDVDIRLLELLEKHSPDILAQPTGVEYEDFLDIILYGKDFANAQRVEPDFENALRFTLCIFIDAIVWETRYNQIQPIEDGTAMENRSRQLKKLIRQSIGPVYEDYRKRLSDGNGEQVTRKSRAQDEGEEEDDWLVSGGGYEEPNGCEWGGLPEPPLDGNIKSLWESENVEVGTEVEYGCWFNNEPIGRTWVSKCLSNKQWSEVDYKCQLAWCDAPPILAHMSVESPSDRYRVGDVVNLVCDPGFTISNNTRTIECQTNGTWSRVLSWCTRISCDRPTLPSGAEIVNETIYRDEDKTTVRCANQKIIVTTCNTDFKWTPHPLDAC